MNGPIATVNAQTRGAADFDKIIWGAYHLLGRLDEVQPKPAGQRNPDPAPTVRLRRHFAQFGYLLDDVTQHGWWPAHALSSEERLARAREGVEHIDRVIAALAPDTLLTDLADLDAYLRTKAIPQYHRSPMRKKP